MAEGRRLLGAAIAALLLGAAALGGASMLTWADQRFTTPLRGDVPVEVSGAEVSPSLGPLALVALASVAAVLATAGLARRGLGAVLVALAALPVLSSVTALARGVNVAEFAASGDVPTGADPSGSAALHLVGPILGIAGGLGFVVAGLSLVLLAHRMPRLGSKYRSPAAQRSAGDSHGQPHTGDSERRLWDLLDSGNDPTTDFPAAEYPPPPGSGSPRG